MAIKGLSKIVVGKYNDDVKSAPTYTDCETVAKAVSYGLTVNESESSELFADNDVAEMDKGVFKNGELSLGTDDLTQAASKMMLGAKEVEASLGGEKKVSEGVYDDDRVSPYLGVGFIELHQRNNVDSYRAIVLPKTYFNIPEQAANTKGDAVEWQTPTITGKVLRSDLVDENYNHPWMIDAYFVTEKEALSYLEFKLGKKESVAA